MIRHFFKLVWNRRRSNTLILIELLVSFLVLCGMLVSVYHTVDLFRQPLGFEYRNIWHLDMGHSSYSMVDDEGKMRLKETAAQIGRTIDMMDEVVDYASVIVNVPYTHNRYCDRCWIDGASKMVDISNVSTKYLDTIGLNLVAGRWLEPGDEVLNWVPVVLTRNLAQALYGDENPLGREVAYLGENGEPDQRGENDPIRRVVGVIQDIRRLGEFYPASYSEFRTLPMLSDDLEDRSPTNFVFKVHEGVAAAFEKELLEAVKAVAPTWSFNVYRLEDIRSNTKKDRILQGGLWIIIAWFLLAMVGMGLAGVLWQNVTQRTHEMGLRRALGATAAQVRWQILGEMLALTTLAVIIGTVLFIQFPLLNIIPMVGLSSYLIGLVLALFVIYPFVILCGLYPSWLATRIHPVQALQYK